MTQINNDEFEYLSLERTQATVVISQSKINRRARILFFFLGGKGEKTPTNANLFLYRVQYTLWMKFF